MADSGKTVKHFVVVRFFPYQSIDYPYNVLNPDFLAKQAALVKSNIIKSLENQTNKNFELIFYVHSYLLSDKRYKPILATLKDSETWQIRFFKKGDIIPVFKEAFDNYDYVIHTRMDFDDFVYKDAVADTQNKINECADILSYGYCKGYRYRSLEENLYHYLYLSNGTGHPSVFQSLIMKSSFAKDLPFVSSYSFAHHKVKPKLKNFLEKNNIEFSENMFLQNVSDNAYIYFRHEFANEIIAKKRKMTDNLKRSNSVLVEDMTKEQLEEEFGFNYEVKSLK